MLQGPLVLTERKKEFVMIYSNVHVRDISSFKCGMLRDSVMMISQFLKLKHLKTFPHSKFRFENIKLYEQNWNYKR